MARRTRLKYTEDMQSYIWDRYQLGDSVKSIGRSFDRPSSSIHNLLARTGGIRPRERKRSPQALSLAERKEISRGLVSGLSIRAIAIQLNRAPSTVSREVSVMVVFTPTEPLAQTEMHGIDRKGPKSVNWFRTDRCAAKSK